VSLPEVVSKRAEIEAGKLDKAWSIINDIVVHKGRIFLPATFTLGLCPGARPWHGP
jgi:hypothetical protein